VALFLRASSPKHAPPWTTLNGRFGDIHTVQYNDANIKDCYSGPIPLFLDPEGVLSQRA
jgi:hypothetical protein